MPWFYWLDVGALGASMILASALALLALGANPKGKLNISFALFAVTEGIWAGFSMVLRLALWLERGNIMLFAESAAMAGAVMAVFLFIFVVVFVDRRSWLTDAFQILGGVFLLAMLYPLFNGQIVVDAKLEANGSTTMQLSQLGKVLGPVPLLFMAGALYLCWAERRKTQEPFVLFSLLVMLGGFLFGGLVNLPIPILSITNTISVGILGFGVARRQVFNPLKERTRQLEEEIEKRAQTQSELESSEQRYRELAVELEERVKNRTAALEATNAELQAFAYSVSHDLRAPLRAINGFSRALKEDIGDELDPEPQQYLDRMHQAGVRMSQMIDDLLKLSRAAQGELVRRSVDVTALANDVARELRDGNPDQPMTVDVAPNLAAKGDPTLLRAVFENLMDNAWKFTQDCEDPKVAIGLDEKNGTTVFVVRDNGIGFDSKYADKIFSPFDRLHSQDEYEGSGIGLATVRRIVRKHGGRIWAESEPGSGTAFYFTLAPSDTVFPTAGDAARL